MVMAGLWDGDMVGHEEEGEEGLDLDRLLWVEVEAGEGGVAVDRRWLVDVDVMAAEGCVCVPEEAQGVCDG